ncbi:cell envelope-related transcriptional attenuator [Segniliparus rotundus DSM 44985]|uniref:Cell envelope-related transcriptional attenuator n=1 Tax=Segniliparus rotundus (strain ATCC BAA-972 / CDC 1076 / CIP 108378 / DSM 44985 / JCM 13578) TaxID=640132 RepID=D6ZCE1_SEGRD|nr:cell envelope-related transcriptional attenuator [Segniliparus rotundus DSM 44985]
MALTLTGAAWNYYQKADSLTKFDLSDSLAQADDGAQDILLVGVDSRTDAAGNPLTQEMRDKLHAGGEEENGTINTDTIILVRIPDSGTSATAVSIPRDSFVKAPGLGQVKINSVYGSTKEAARLQLVQSGVNDAEADRRSTLAARKALFQAVQDLTGVSIDHMAEIGILGFVEFTDALGGVDVCLNNPVDEPLSGANFPAGRQTLDGAGALAFVRQRHDLPRGDLDRIVRQQVFMASLARKALSGKFLRDPGKINQIIAALKMSVAIDDKWNIMDFASKLSDLTGGKVRFETMPVVDPDGQTPGGQSVVIVDPKSVQAYFQGLLKEPQQEPPSAQPQETVDVENASNIPGLAQKIAASLGEAGVNTGDVGEYTGPKPETSAVFARSTDDAALSQLSGAVGQLPVQVDSSLPAGHVRLVLAGDSATTITVRTPEPNPQPEDSGPPDANHPINASAGDIRCVN